MGQVEAKVDMAVALVLFYVFEEQDLPYRVYCYRHTLYILM